MGPQVVKLAQLAGKNKKGLAIGGTIAGAIIGGFLLILMLLPLKLEMMMKNLYNHHFKSSGYSYTTRKKVAVRKYMADRFSPDGAIKSDVTPVWRSVFNSLHTNQFERRLQQTGYKIEYEGANSRRRILSITPPGETNAIRDYNLLFEKKAGRKDILRVAEDITHGEGWFKRLRTKRYLTQITGTKWHWLDPVSQPYRQLKVKVHNELFGFILKNEIVRGFADKLMTEFLGKEIAEKYAAQLTAQAASETVVAKVTAQALTQVVAESSNPITLAVLAAQCGCALDKFIHDGTLQKLAKQKAEAEYMITFTKWQSMAHQVKDGKADNKALAANMELLTSEDGKKDVGDSNNYWRATGTNVEYKASADCESGREMCENAQPSKILDSTVVGRGANALTGISNNAWLRLVPGLPGSYLTTAFCATVVKAINVVGGILGSAVDFILRNTPGVSVAWNFLKDTAGDMISGLFGVVMRFVMPPIVTPDTRGPLLVNAIGAGADAANSRYQRSYCGDEADDAKCKLSPAEAGEIRTAYDSEMKQRHQQSSPWSQIASLDDPYSLVSRFMPGIPTSPKVAMYKGSQSIMAMLSPRAFQSLFGSLFGRLTAAPVVASGTYESPFGIDQYGFTMAQLNAPLGDTANDALLAKLDTDVACSLVEEFATGADYPAECIIAGGSPTDGAVPTGTAQELAAQIIANPNFTYPEPGQLARLALEAAAEGRPSLIEGRCNAGDSSPLSPSLLGALLAVSSKYKVGIGYLTNGCHSDGSTHYQGRGVDINTINGQQADGPSELDTAFVNELINYLPRGSRIGPGQCLNNINTQNGKVSLIDDVCNHLHVDVP